MAQSAAAAAAGRTRVVAALSRYIGILNPPDSVSIHIMAVLKKSQGKS
jgi:hypothetical protein